MHVEIVQIKGMNALTTVPANNPEGTVLLGTRFVNKIKLDSDGQLVQMAGFKTGSWLKRDTSHQLSSFIISFVVFIIQHS